MLINYAVIYLCVVDNDFNCFDVNSFIPFDLVSTITLPIWMDVFLGIFIAISQDDFPSHVDLLPAHLIKLQTRFFETDTAELIASTSGVAVTIDSAIDRFVEGHHNTKPDSEPERI